MFLLCRCRMSITGRKASNLLNTKSGSDFKASLFAAVDSLWLLFLQISERLYVSWALYNHNRTIKPNYADYSNHCREYLEQRLQKYWKIFTLRRLVIEIIISNITQLKKKIYFSMSIMHHWVTKTNKSFQNNSLQFSAIFYHHLVVRPFSKSKATQFLLHQVYIPMTQLVFF